MRHEEPLLSAARTHRGCVRRDNQDAVVERPDAGLWAVADGIGGHTRGADASATLAQALNAAADTAQGWRLLQQLADAVQTVNRSIAAQADGDISGTTLALLVLEADNAHCLWVGDSRVYLLRDGTLRRLTADHADPSTGALTRAVGVDSAVELASSHEHLYQDDVFLLCSDGLTTVLNDTTLGELLLREPPTRACARLVEEALVRGAPDNVSCITVHIQG